MAFTSIFFANLAEVALPLVRRMRQSRRIEEVEEDHGLCDRFLFSESDNRLLITPFPIDSQFLADARQLLGFKNVVNVSPVRREESLCYAVLADQKLLKLIQEVVSVNPQIKLHSYVASPEFLELVKFLRSQGLSFQTPELPTERNIWTTAFFDSKAGFRQAVVEMDRDFPQMPLGTVCNRPEEVIHWAKYLFDKGAGCVLKTNHGLAGAGLVILRKGEIPKEELADKISQILKGERYWQKDPIIVEEYILPDKNICGGTPNIELRTTDSRVELLYTCGMRVTPAGVFCGVEMGRGALPEGMTQVLARVGRLFGEFLLGVGYRGFFELDFVAGVDGKLYPLEANLRRTGGTHVWETGQRILGNDFLQHYYIVANNLVAAPRFTKKGYPVVKEALSAWLYPLAGQKEGVILTIVNLLSTGRLGYMVIGPNRQRVRKIEEGFLREISN